MRRLSVGLIAAAAACMALPAAGHAVPAQVQGGAISVGVRGQTTRVPGREMSVDQMRQHYDSVLRLFHAAPVNSRQSRIAEEELDNTADAIARALNVPMGVDLQDPRIAAAIRRDPEEGRRAIRGALPKGMLGLTIAGPMHQVIRNDSVFIRYLVYPHIDAVEPNSPADAKGLPVGGRVMAFDNVDVLAGGEFNFSRLLKPARLVSMRVEQDGRVETYDLRVVDAPDGTLDKRAADLVTLLRRDFTPTVSMMGPFPGQPGGQQVTIIRQMHPDSANTFMGVTGPSNAAGGMGFIATSASIWGMQVVDLDARLRSATGQRAGVFVALRTSGTPSDHWGIQPADVITRVGGTEVRSVVELRRALELKPGERVWITVMREGKAVTLEAVRK